MCYTKQSLSKNRNEVEQCILVSGYWVGGAKASGVISFDLVEESSGSEGWLTQYLSKRWMATLKCFSLIKRTASLLILSSP